MRWFLVLLVLFALTNTIVIATVSLDAWKCGHTSELRQQTWERVNQECPETMDRANKCCKLLLMCYGQRKGPIRDRCDGRFFKCVQSAMGPCSHLSDFASFVVMIQGDEVFNSMRGIKNKPN